MDADHPNIGVKLACRFTLFPSGARCNSCAERLRTSDAVAGRMLKTRLTMW